MAIELPALPYEMDALEPYISAQTLGFHHGKHHQAYVTNANNLTKDTPLENASVEELIIGSVNKADKVALFNNTAQVWNHTFYW
ncbi:MAG: superoxide dismutase [Fe], partial [Arcobacteraceae bacterium]|nr:superoxide dismutase [Fe] [Arcobacteraceae bacterium]